MALREVPSYFLHWRSILSFWAKINWSCRSSPVIDGVALDAASQNLFSPFLFLCNSGRQLAKA